MFQIGKDRVALVSDSSCDLNDEQLAAYDIRLISLRVATTKGDFRDRAELTNAQVFELLKTELPKTSLPRPEDAVLLYQQLKDEGCTRVLHISISSGLSGTFQMLQLIAETEEDLKIDLVDSRTLASGLGLLVLRAGEDLSRGMSIEETIADVEHARETQLGCYMVRTLEYLRKGGRIGLVEGVVGSLLQIKPVIFVNDDGVYQTLVKARGLNNARRAMVDEVVRRYTGKPIQMAIVHANVPEDAAALEEEMKQKLQVVSSYIAPVSPALAIHTGEGLLGIIAQIAE